MTFVATQMRICKNRSIETQTKLIPTRTIATQVNLHKKLVNVFVQTEGLSPHNMKIKTEEVFSHSISTQIEGKSKDFLLKNDPMILQLWEELTQAQLALEQHQQKIASLQQNQKLQK